MSDVAAIRPLSEASVLSPRQAAAELGSLGINAGVFWLRQRRLVTTIPAVEFGRHRTQSPLELVRWGDVLDEIARRRAPTESPSSEKAESPPSKKRAPPTGLLSGGLNR